MIDWFRQFIDRYVEETNGPDSEALIACLDRVRDSYRQHALRARSSAPEDREEALGNLLAVIHGDGGHRALEVGTKQAALEAEKIVARLLSSAPEAGGEAVAWKFRNMDLRQVGVTMDEREADRKAEAGWEIEPLGLITHPATPSADNLRIAVEAFDAITDLSAALRNGGPDSSDLQDLSDNLNTAVDLAHEALAALKAEGGK